MNCFWLKFSRLGPCKNYATQRITRLNFKQSWAGNGYHQNQYNGIWFGYQLHPLTSKKLPANEEHCCAIKSIKIRKQ